jgi:hypothetical protein
VNKQIIVSVSIVIGVIACTIERIFFGNPPLALPTGALEITWIALHIPRMFILMALGLPRYLEETAVYILTFAQWALISYAILWATARIIRLQSSQKTQ